MSRRRPKSSFTEKSSGTSLKEGVYWANSWNDEADVWNLVRAWVESGRAQIYMFSDQKPRNEWGFSRFVPAQLVDPGGNEWPKAVSR